MSAGGAAASVSGCRPQGPGGVTGGWVVGGATLGCVVAGGRVVGGVEGATVVALPDGGLVGAPSPGSSGVSGGTVVVARRREELDPDERLVDAPELDEFDPEGIRPEVLSFGSFAPGAGISPAAWVTRVTAAATNAA